ncbi:4-(cytidine 5'-diphospho)-2-C-methyl-D-erythritol kinase [Azospirillum griseum]|uniref:4-diphosphocytidyl-2-C-methyl-D-erythritol kinase n=1 Tax=Azospirillum griseum TaxID=2496639 RepID=A0A431VEM0_9PROT|nr:4-(cytidine 5'-diphospho)-2-C-methyl-D-erythritol kinase [Azospirillum griseum]RTR18338.1 4-(cytidine 5'-diphospho)-2-C-methyl-D-erythritol kinase [Azospirillum griseum]
MIATASTPAHTPAQRITEAAPAKLNLYLHVTGKRADGFHELDSLVAFTELGDTLTLEVADGDADLTLSICGPFAAALAGEDPAGNLVTRAARRLADSLGRRASGRITLTKNLPVASGIGGGSADAAACLRALARLWGLPPDAPVLFEVAAGLGADIPVCVVGENRHFGGVGDQLAPAPALPDCPVVLVNPNVPVPTPAVFRARGPAPFSTPARLTHAPGSVAALAEALRARRNDLTAPALTVAPVIATVLTALEGTHGCLLARLSGSGATCFALYPTTTEAEAAAAAIRMAEPGWWAHATRLRTDGP